MCNYSMKEWNRENEINENRTKKIKFCMTLIWIVLLVMNIGVLGYHFYKLFNTELKVNDNPITPEFFHVCTIIEITIATSILNYWLTKIYN